MFYEQNRLDQSLLFRKISYGHFYIKIYYIVYYVLEYNIKYCFKMLLQKDNSLL